jgi:microsomal dipeptidase-like Zn-dependent dipeptidase
MLIWLMILRISKDFKENLARSRIWLIRGSSVKLVALGPYFDGGFGLDSISAAFGMEATPTTIALAVEYYGHKPAEIQAVMHGNWLRVLRQNLLTNY